MKSIGLLCLLFPFIVMGAPTQIKLTFHVDDYDKPSINLYVAGSTKQITLDKNGNGIVRLQISKPQYARMGSVALFLEPGKDLAVTVSNKTIAFKAQFSGAGAPENKKLNSLEEYGVIMKLAEAVSKGELSLDKAVETFRNDSARQAFSEPFKRMEAERVRFAYWEECYYKKCIDKTSFRKMLTEDDAFIESSDYQRFLLDVNDAWFEEMDSVDHINRPALSAVKHFKNPKLVEFLIDNYVWRSLRRNGIDSTEAMLILFEKYVKDEGKKAALQGELAKFAGARKGAACFNFSYPDADGKKVSLADLKGKYVLIDCWATWCGDCLAQMPYLHKVEEQFSKNNIVFVGISFDEEKLAERWKKKAKELPAIQIRATDKRLQKHFMVDGIPRFILLDPNGRVVSGFMPEPSNPKFSRILESFFKQ